MTSRSIQFFGMLSASILIFFIVAFLGKDFYKMTYHGSLSSEAFEDMPEKAVIQETQISDIISPVKNQLSAEKDNLIVKELKHRQKALDIKTIDHKVSKNVITDHKVSSVALPKDSISSVNKQIKQLIRKNKLLGMGVVLGRNDKKVLDDIVNILKTVPYEYTLEIEGHTQKGIPFEKSLTMAKTVQGYMEKKLKDIKMTTDGYGNTYPLSDDLYNSMNHRVEILVRRK